MSNTNNTMQTQTSNALHNAIMEAGGKDPPPMLAPEPTIEYKWTDKDVPVAEGSTETTTERYMENYKNVSQDIRDQLNAEAEAVQIILTGIDNDIYSTVDACPNACEMWKAIERLKQGESINVQDLETNLYWEFRKFTSRDGESLESYYSRGTGYDNQRIVNVVGAMENVEVTPVAADNSGPIFDTEPLQKVPNNDNYNVFAIESKHPEQSKFVNDTYPIEQDEHNVIIDSLDISYDRKQVDQDDDDDLANERDLVASLIEKLKCDIDDSKNHNNILETSNKALVDKLKGEIEDLKTKNKSLESSNNHFKEVNNELSKTNQLMFNDIKKFQAELDRYHDVKYASKVKIDSAKAKGDLMSYKMESEKSFNEYTRKINDLNQMISEIKKELFAHQETIFILSQEKAAQIKFYKTREDKEIDKVISLENKVKVLDNIIYKTGQSVQKMNMLNRNCKTSFAKLEFLKKAQRANPCLYDIGVYTELDEVTNLQCDYLETLEKCECLEKELSKSKMMSKSFEALQKHTINLELDLHQCKKKIKNDKSFKENQSKEFRKEREQYFEIQDLKAQLQDKGIAISELKKRIEKLKGKSVETKFEKSSVIRQPKAFKSQRPSILGKPTIFSDSLEKQDCSKSKSITKNNVSNDFSKPVTAQILPLNNMPMAVPLSTREPKRIVNQSFAASLRRTVSLKSTNQKPRHTNKKLYEQFTKTWSWSYPKYTPPGYKWKPKSQIRNVNRNVSMPLGNASRTPNILEPMTPRCSTISNTPLHSNSFAARRDNPIHRRLWGNDLLTGSRGTDLYSITLQDTSSPNLICLTAKATSSQAWLWHRRLSYLNFDTINLLSKNDIVIGLPKLKFDKDHLCSSFTAQTLPTQKKSCLKNTNVLAPGMYKIHTYHTQARTSKLPQDSKKTNKSVSFSTGVIPSTSVSRPQLKSNPQGDRVLHSNSRGKKLEVEEHRRNVKLLKNKKSVTACNDSLNAKTVNIKSVSAMCAKLKSDIDVLGMGVLDWIARDGYGCL
nr:integrase, catalytic region, zinc finger, CCHC-type, peptidase aspartic, catalytic [Tanacetum cinerariifolium]